MMNKFVQRIICHELLFILNQQGYEKDYTYVDDSGDFRLAVMGCAR